MRKIIIVFLMAFTIPVFGQTHLEYISEKSDSVALLNRKDIDIINNVFNERNILDSLNHLNEQIISNLESEIFVQDSIILTQSQIIANNNLVLMELENKNNLITETYSKEVRKEKNKRIAYETCAGISIVAIILLLLFGK